MVFFLIRPDTEYWVPCSPNKVFEYLICGSIPIIRADIDYSQYLASCSLMYDRETPGEEIIQGVLDLLGDPVRLRSMMDAAVTLSNRFLFESVGDNYISMYNYLLNGK